ncbi:MAG: questin oxidase family protein [Undibacterium umbellatum]|uniref:questin oxidase family protein n=1 Tax=Undibacterium umbellatum TaxID=2762300 RepID=UPI003BB7D335
MRTSITSMGGNAILRDLLDKNSEFALNAKGTTNHCPMALCALAGMGASAERLQEFFVHWQVSYALPRLPVNEIIEYENFRVYLGKRDSFADLQTCFATRIAECCKNEVINEVLAFVPFAPATTAFHALIRLSYGLQAEHNGEVAAGLASLVVANFDININMSGRPPANSVAAGFQHLSYGMEGKLYPGRMITEKMQAVVNDEQFLRHLPAAPVSEHLLDELARWAIAAYGQTRDFTILHIVTAVNALRQILPYLESETIARSLQDLWIALCAAYVSVGAPALKDIAAYESEMLLLYPEADPWLTLFTKAVNIDDDHVIKLTYTCSQEASLSSSILYQAVVMDMLADHAVPAS